jgi:hypothetical protein
LSLSRPFPKIHEEWELATDHPETAWRVHSDSKSIQLKNNFKTAHLKYIRGGQGQPDSRILYIVEGKNWKKDNIVLEFPMPMQGVNHGRRYQGGHSQRLAGEMLPVEVKLRFPDCG